MAYVWFGAGIAVFIVLKKFFIKGADDSIRVFSHELNHAVVSLMLFKKVHSFHVEPDHGNITHTPGGRFVTVCITLAPYHLPFFTFVLLIVRAAMRPEFYWIADLLTGVTVGFYTTVFKQQTGEFQTDISRFRHRIFPYWFICAFVVFNASIIIGSLLPDKNIFLSFADAFIEYWPCISSLFHSLFVG